MHNDSVQSYAPPRADAIAAKHEVEDMTLGGLKGFVVVLALMIAVTFVIVWVVIRVLLHLSVASDGAVSPFAGAGNIPPAPQIQPSRNHNTLDWQDLVGLREEEHRKLTESAWIGPDKAKARIPIDVAMDMILKQGLPTRQGSPSGGPAALPVEGGAGGLMIAPANPLSLPPGNLPQGNQPSGNERTGYVP